MTGAEIAIIAIGVVAASISAYAAYEGAQAQSQAASYRKKSAENQAAYARQQADIEAQNMEERNRHILAAQHANMGASGVSDEEGSPLLVAADTAAQMRKDVYLTKYGGQIRAGAYEEEAGLQRMYAASYNRAAYIGAGSSLLSSGAGIAANTYYGRYGYYQRPQVTAISD